MVRDHFTYYYGIGAQDVHVVRAAIDLNRFSEQDRPKRRLEWRQRWAIGPEETVAVFAAMNYRLKGLEPLLRATRRLVDQTQFRLLVLGNPRTQKWERMAERLGIRSRVLFAGHCMEMRNAYFASDFMVHPTFYDPCSLVVLEAMACGLPVITTRYNGASELLGPLAKDFVLSNPHDEEQLAWCMKELLDPARRSTCAQAVRRAAANWTFEPHYQQMLQVFRTAAARKQAA
jgi:UDP-glucose:(heptosyl)LPS alpha-1,3-glucosyltransferase